MLGTESNHCQTVRDVIEGKRDVDEMAQASLRTLSERLEKLKKLDKAFNSVAFSSAVKKLTEQNNPVAAY